MESVRFKKISALEPTSCKNANDCEAYHNFYRIKRLWSEFLSIRWSAHLPSSHYFTAVLTTLSYRICARAWASSNDNLFNLMCSLTSFSLDLRCINDKNRFILLKKKSVSNQESMIENSWPKSILTGGQSHGQQSKSVIDVNIINSRVVRTRGLLTEKPPVFNVWQKNKLLLN